MRRSAFLLLVIVLLGVTRDGRAEGSDATHLTKEGLALRRQRRDAEALDRFRRAYALDPTARTLAQVALAEQALGQWVQAESDLRAALAYAGEPWIAVHRQELDAGLADIRKHLGGLEIVADVAGAEAWVNGRPAGVLPLAGPVPVEAGSVVVEVRANGYAPARRLTSVEAGEVARESVQLVPLVRPSPLESAPPPGPAPESAAPTRPSPPSTRRDQPASRNPNQHQAHSAGRDVSFVLFGAAALGLSAGTYFSLQTLADKSDRDANCRAGCNKFAVAPDANARSAAVRSTAWFVLGAVAGGAGAALFWWPWDRSVPAAGSVGMGLEIGPGRAGVALGGGW